MTGGSVSQHPGQTHCWHNQLYAGAGPLQSAHAALEAYLEYAKQNHRKARVGLKSRSLTTSATSDWLNLETLLSIADMAVLGREALLHAAAAQIDSLPPIGGISPPHALPLQLRTRETWRQVSEQARCAHWCRLCAVFGLSTPGDDEVEDNQAPTDFHPAQDDACSPLRLARTRSVTCSIESF